MERTAVGDPKYRIFNAAIERLAGGMRWSLKGQSGSAAADICCGATFLTIES
jgi:hypothetical protein